MVVTALSAEEDPSGWLLACRPERVKLLQCLIVPGENDDAADLACPADAFEKYVSRAQQVEVEGIHVAVERADDLLDSYAMIDPRGRFRQARSDGYVTSDEIAEVGLDAAWRQVGGCDLEKFVARGGSYDDGAPPAGVTAPIIAIEGLDGCGKSTTVDAMARRLDAVVVRCPPEALADERKLADRSKPDARRAFYWRAHARAMEQATDIAFSGKAVVMDRCFASTAAYGEAERGGLATESALPPRTPRPDVVIFLDLPEAERCNRIGARTRALTSEERRLGDDAEFRGRVRRGYLNLGAVRIDATGCTDEVVDRIVRAVRRELGVSLGVRSSHR
jgi:thymidylate kinase